MNKPTITQLPTTQYSSSSVTQPGMVAQTLGTALPGSVLVSNGTSPSWVTDSITASSSTASIDLRGEDADIRINGESLRETLRGIQERLLILTPNKQLEAEWEELREIGEKYRALEKELTSASKMWKILSQD